jgi:hypothetical protein
MAKMTWLTCKDMAKMNIGHDHNHVRETKLQRKAFEGLEMEDTESMDN